MKAVVLNADRRLELQERERPRPKPGEVLIRSHFCGICGTDLHSAEIPLFRPPMVMGHEFAGEVVEVGEGVNAWSVGDKVTVNPNENACRNCEYCHAGRYNLCTTAILDNPVGVARDGGMAEYVAVPAVHLHKLPDSLDTRAAAWVEPLAVAVRAVRRSGLRMGDRAAVIGGGPIGQLIVQLLQSAGATHITLVEPSEFRRSVALSSGADQALTPAELAAALDADAFAGVHQVYECSGHPTALQSAAGMVLAGGEIRLIGVSQEPLTVDSMTLLTKEVTITSNFIYVDEFDTAIDLLDQGRVDVEKLTSQVMPLERFEEAFAALRQPDTTIKVLLECSTP